MPTAADASSAGATVPSSRPVDRAALARWARHQHLQREAPWLHGEVARRMAERLVLFKAQPKVVIDWWAATGGSGAALAGAFPHARVIEVAPDIVGAAVHGRAPSFEAPWWSAARWRRKPASVEAAAVPEGSGQLLWANMMLHAVADPPAVMRRWREVLAVEGLLMFSTLGPDTLASLRSVYREAGWGPPHAPFTDMHDLGDMLGEAGLADPVMDQERLRLTWATPEALLAELRTLGINTDPARHRGLRTPRWRGRLLGALREQAQGQGDHDGRIALDFELVYGHAFKPAPRARVAAETRLPLDEMRRMVRSGRKTDAPRWARGSSELGSLG